jgi:hypothetical protein
VRFPARAHHSGSHWIEELCWYYLEALYRVVLHGQEQEIRVLVDRAARVEVLGTQNWIAATPLMQRLRRMTPGADVP